MSSDSNCCAQFSLYVKTSTHRSAGASRRALQQPASERLSERPHRRSPPLCFDQGCVQRAAQLAALQASKRTGMTQRRLHSTSTCQTSRAPTRACFPPSPTRHRRSSLPFAALRAQAMWMEAHGLSLVQGVLVLPSSAATPSPGEPSTRVKCGEAPGRFRSARIESAAPAHADEAARGSLFSRRSPLPTRRVHVLRP